MIFVTLPYDPTWKPLDWVKKNCPSYITNAVHLAENNVHDTSRIDYFFSQQRDATIFALKWL